MRLSGKSRAFGCAPLVAIAVGLSLFGLLMQYSASGYAALTRYGDEFFYLKKQSIALVAAVACMLFFSRVEPRLFAKLSPVFLVVSIGLLAALFIPGLGVEMYGATRWLDLGIGTVQPSEFAKFALVLFMASVLAEKREIGFGRFALCAFAAASVCVLIMLEPNMSIAVLVALVAMFMLFVCGVRLKWFAALSVPAVAGAVLLIVAEPYRLKRLLAFLDPWASPLGEGYQLIQSYYALGSGGMFGVGLFNSRQKYLFLPFAESDFVFSVVGEELGFVGCVAVIAAFCALIWYGFRTASRAEDTFSAFAAAGLTSVIAFQTLLNIAVVTGSIPPTGLPMPFLGYGGSSLVTFCSAVGMIDSIARRAPERLCPVPIRAVG